MSLWGTKRAFAQHLSMYAVFGIDSGPQESGPRLHGPKLLILVGVGVHRGA